MRLVPVTRAEGLALARDLPDARPGAIPLLRRGTTISVRYQQHLLNKGIHAVWVHDELSAGIDPVELMPEPIRQQTADRVHGALTVARNSFATGQPMPPAAMEELKQIVDLIARSLMDSPDAALALSDLAGADGYTHRHSINVAALGLLLARECFRRDGWIDFRNRHRFDRIEERLTQIGLGLLLHDIGKMAVPATILNKPGKLDAQEWEIMRTHPDAGAALLNPAVISPLVISVVRSHHERWDGSGYPRGLVGPDISQFARIAAVADVYDAATSERPYKRAAPPCVGVGLITGGDGTAFDPQIVSMFRRCVFPYPVGTEVTLSDGMIGVVTTVDPAEPEAPIVRIPAPDGPLELRVDMAQLEAA